MARKVLTEFLLCPIAVSLLVLTTDISTAVDVSWNESIDNNYANPDNWSTGFRPAFFLDEVAVIGNTTVANGVANVSSPIIDDPAGITLGQGVGTAGTLNIQNNGMLTVKPGPLTSGTVRVGSSGVGTLNILSGGTLIAERFVLAGGNGSQLNVSGTAVTNVNANVTLAGTSQITGPSVDFSVGGDISLTGTSIFNPEITGSVHSVIDVSGTAFLDGTLQLDFTGHTPTVGESWDLLDASMITGSFSAVTAPGVSLAPGEQFVVSTVADNSSTNGYLARLTLEQAPLPMVLQVNPITGQAYLFNNSNEASVDIEGYDIFSPSSSLLPNNGNWNSLDDQDVAGGDWRESNVSTTRLAELKEAGSTTFGTNGSTVFDLGTLYDVATGTPDLVLQVLEAGDSGPAAGSVIYSIPGDFDGDMDVDEDDLTDSVLGWEVRYGSDLDGLDFLVWQQNFGLQFPLTAEVAAVPEPGASLLSLAGVFCLFYFTPTRQRSNFIAY